MAQYSYPLFSRPSVVCAVEEYPVWGGSKKSSKDFAFACSEPFVGQVCVQCTRCILERLTTFIDGLSCPATNAVGHIRNFAPIRRQLLEISLLSET